MNFLNGEITQKADKTCVTGDGFCVELPNEKAAVANAHSVRNVTLGIRPSDLVYDVDAAEDQSLSLSIVVSEYIGAQTVLLCDCGSQKVEVELKSTIPIDRHGQLHFAINPEGIHLFDRKTEVAL